MAAGTPMVWPGPRPLPRPKLSNYHIGTHFKLFLNSLMKRLQLGGARIGDDGKAAVLLKYYLHVLLKCEDVMCSATIKLLVYYAAKCISIYSSINVMCIHALYFCIFTGQC